MAISGDKVANSRSSTRDETEILVNISQQIKDLCKEMREMRNEQRSMATSLDSTHEKIDECKSILQQQKEDIKRCSKDVEALQVENNTLKKQMLDLKREVATMHQYSRANCVEIRGVPEKKSENISQVVFEVARAVRFKLESWMIDAVHRLSGNTSDTSKPRGIILKLVRRLDYNELLRLAKVKRGFSASELGYVSDCKVYINPSMSKENRVLMASARNMARTCGYRFVWFANNKVMVRKAQGHPAIPIISKEQLDSMTKRRPQEDLRTSSTRMASEVTQPPPPQSQDLEEEGNSSDPSQWT